MIVDEQDVATVPSLLECRGVPGPAARRVRRQRLVRNLGCVLAVVSVSMVALIELAPHDRQRRAEVDHFPAPQAGVEVDPRATTPAPVPLETLLCDAEAAARENNYRRTLRLCEEALSLDEGNVRGITACAIAACNVEMRSTAKAYIGQMSPRSHRQQALKQICLRKGVEID